MTPAQAVGFAVPSAIREEPVYRRLAEHVGTEATVLDLGCGKAEYASKYFRSEQYRGVDCSPALIAMARATNPAHLFYVNGGPGFHPAALPDYVLVKSVLEHIPEDEAVALYETALRLSRIAALIAWHMEPTSDRATVQHYEGELGTMLQIRHRREAFRGAVLRREVCGTHVIWTVVRK